MTAKQILAAAGAGSSLLLTVATPLIYEECSERREIYRELRTVVRLATAAIDTNTRDLERHEKERH